MAQPETSNWTGTMSAVNCFQVNMHNSTQATIELLNLMKKNDTNIAMIQEPYTYKNRLGIKVQNMAIFPNKKTGNPRTAIIASKHLQMTELSDLCNEYATVVVGLVNGKKMMFASMYLHSNRGILDLSLIHI